jgi:RNA polymerase sigma-70 factor, ECF subfamily
MGLAERSASRMKFFSRRSMRVDEVQALYQQHGPGLLLYGCSLLGRKHAAEDVLQQVFMKLLEQNTTPEEPKPYLFRAVHNAALNLMRNEHKQVELADIEPWFEAPQPDHAARATLTVELMRVPEEQRQVLVLHVWGGLSFEEIGSVLDISANTAASRYRYAMQKLRAAMQPQDSHVDE